MTPPTPSSEPPVPALASTGSRSAGATLLAYLAADPILRLSLAAFFAFALLYALPILSPAQFTLFSNEISFIVLAGLVLFAIGHGFAAVRHRGERRLWLFVAASFGFWLSEEVLELAAPAVKGGGTPGVLGDWMILLIYLAMVLGVEEAPHEHELDRPRDPIFRLEQLGSIIFVLGLVTYFVVIPWRFGTAAANVPTPSFFLYLLLDVYLVVRFAVEWRRCGSRRWRWLYGLLGATPLFWTVTDGVNLLEALGAVDPPSGFLWDGLWYSAFAPPILAARLRSYQFAEPKAAGETPTRALPSRRSTTPLVVSALSLPAIHLAMNASRLLDRTSEAPRAVLMLALLTFLGALALFQQRFLERRNRALEANIQRMNQELVQAQKMEAIGRLAGGVAHDFNNLLTVILGHSDLLLKELRGPTELRQRAEEIHKASGRAAELTAQLLAFGRRQILRARPLELNGLTRNLQGFLGRLIGEHIELAYDLAQRPCWVHADPAQLEQVIVNLAVNARDAMPRGGRLTMTIRTVEVSAVTTREGVRMAPGPYALLAVSDTGSGMDEETRSRIFEPFFTTKELGKGTGLGLSTVFGIVKQSSGYIFVESAQGRGTTFRIYLPEIAAPVDGRLATPGAEVLPGAATSAVRHSAGVETELPPAETGDATAAIPAPTARR